MGEITTKIAERTMIGPVWITQYALSSGVTTADKAERCDGINATMIVVGDGASKIYYHKPHWHTSEAEAIARVQEMRLSAVRIAERKLTKLDAIDPATLVRAARPQSTGQP